jgi:polyisoprenoid-binding protein YceI
MLLKPTLTLLLLIMLQITGSAQPVYKLDIQKSKMQWNTGKVMGGHSGYLFFSSGSLSYSPGGQPLSGSFSLNMNSMRSTDRSEADNQKTDATLRTEAFFHAEKYPAATIEVRKIARIGTTNTYKVNGDLTIKGITNPIVFTASIITNGNTANITGNVDIHRSMWNIDHKPQTTTAMTFLSDIGGQATDIHVSLDLILSK